MIHRLVGDAEVSPGGVPRRWSAKAKCIQVFQIVEWNRPRRAICEEFSQIVAFKLNELNIAEIVRVRVQPVYDYQRLNLLISGRNRGPILFRERCCSCLINSRQHVRKVDAREE